MKLFPKHTECPYCRTVYRYGDVKKAVWKKEQTCYHCKKTFKVVRRGFLFLATELILVYAMINAVAIGVMGTVSFFALFVMNMVPVVAAILLLPLYIDFKK